MSRAAALGDQVGFTLLELLLSMTLLSLILTLLFSGLHLGSTGWGAFLQRVESIESGYLVERFLRRDLSALYPLRLTDGRGRRIAFDGGPSSISYLTEFPAHRGGGLYRVTIEAKEQEDGSSLEYSFARHVGADWSNGAGTRSRSLLSAIDELSFEYLLRRPRTDEVEWQSEWASRNALPSLVRLRYRPRDGMERELIIPIYGAQL
jgi:general secretion pathway protein J